MTLPRLFCAAALLLLSAPAYGEAPLFAKDTVLKISLPVDFADLCRPRESENCDFTQTVLIYGDAAGKKHSLPVEIKVRGGWRSLSRNCSTPLLWVRFTEDRVAGTPFAGQSLLPLTTHCGKGLSLESRYRPARRSDFEQYLLREFLAHRVYNLITELSLRARLVRISYPDPERPGRSAQHYAFFTEHFVSAAARTGKQYLARGGFDPDRLDAQAAARLALFQFMIGNTDWSIARERNTMLLQDSEGNQLPVPYDMDMSGLVNAAYAGPPPGLPIDDVRERYFQGYCQPGIDWNALYTEFNDQKRAIMGLAYRLPGLSPNSERWTRYYLESFFDVLDSKERRRKAISEACQPWPPSPDDDAAQPGN